jgi:hypothetical protein
MYVPEKLLGLAILAGIAGVVIFGYLLAWRSRKTAYRRVGSLMLAAIAGLLGLVGVWWTIGAFMPFPPLDGTPLWELLLFLLVFLVFSLPPLGAFYICAKFIRQASKS